MSEAKRLLIVAHNPSPNTDRLKDAVLRGATNEDIENVEAVWKPPLEAGPDDVLACDAILMGTTENLGYMSGALKDFFDRTYYSVIEEKQGLPCALYIRAGQDGTGTRRAVESIVTGLSWSWSHQIVLFHGSWREEWLEQAEELGMYMAAGLDAGIL